MGHSSLTDSDAVSIGPSAASLLGIKGPLRFRPHGSSQKPHVILRRVTVSGDSSDEEEDGRIVRFSLFAAKRIEVKPGKEILLTVASHDGKYKDQAIVFEGDILCTADISDEEEDTQVADEEEVYIPPIREAIPPKMRRTWTKKVEEVSQVIPTPERPTVAHVSVGVQVEPLYMSRSMQAQPSCISSSSQTHTISVSASVQVDPTVPIQVSAAVQTAPDSRRYMNSDIQTEEITSLPYCGSYDASSRDVQETLGERSLSPMELDSPLDSPVLSPVQSRPLSPLYSPSVLPFDTRTATPPRLSIVTKSETVCGGLNGYALASSQVSQQSIPQSTPAAVPMNDAASLVLTSTPRTRPQKREIPNPFVSAGFVTEFVGPLGPASTQANNITGMSKPVKAEETKFMSPSTLVHKTLPLPASVPVKLKMRNAPRSSLPASGTIAFSSSTTTSTLTVSEASEPRPTKVPTPQSPSTSQNAVASSSKLLPNKPVSVAVAQQIIPSGPRSLINLSTRARDKSPVSSGSWTGLRPTLQPDPDTKTSSPPPDPKSLAYIPSGPSSNPLNIRPSANVPRGGVTKPPPSAPKSLSQAPPKKRVVVGAGWPFVKATNGTGPIAALPPSTPAPPQPALPPSTPPNTISSNLSNILSYASPSPPPSTPPPPPPPPIAAPATVPITAASKWKPVKNDTPTRPTANAVIPAASLCPTLVEDMQKKEQLILQTPQLQKSSPVVPKSAPPLSLKDRIGPASQTPATPTQSSPIISSNAVNGRDLRSRISDAPPSTPSKPTNSSSGSQSRNRVESVSLKPSQSLPATPIPQPPPITPQPLSHPPLLNPPQPLTHPLPPKPVLALSQAPTPSRGVKRERPLTPDSSPLSRRRKTFRWPTVDSNHTVGLKGDGELGIRHISFSSDGSFFALSCADRTIRIWNNRERTEIARLSHNAQIVAVAWMEGDAGVVSLGEDGLVSKWTRTGQNHWQWAKVLDAGNERRSDEDQVCLAYMRDRIAVSFPRMGVKVWVWLKGTWQPQRSILRQNVSAIKFVEEGAALIGGTRDGVLWHCEIPNGTLRAYAFLKSKINSLDLNPSESHVLVGQVGGYARVVGIRQTDNKGSIEQSYSCKETEARPNGGFGALFATHGQAILFGSVEGCVLVWDRKKGAIVYGLEHEEDDLIQAVASYDGLTSKDGCLVTGTKGGHLAWWSQPVAAPQPVEDTHKRAKLGK